MKKTYRDLQVQKSDDFNSIVSSVELPFPFDAKFINLLKENNLFPQEYYYIRNNDDFAFFILSKMKLNIFTFAKLKLSMKIKIIGMPCSISEQGYYTNNEKMMLDYIKTIKGVKLVLNVQKTIPEQGITVGKTLPTCIFVNDFKNIHEYMSSLRSSYRRRISKAIVNCENIVIQELKGKCPKTVYDLYLRTYEKSPYKLERLEAPFFDKVDSDKILFSKDGVALGFVLLKKHKETLYFMLCGMNYDVDVADLYYYMLYKIIEYAIENKCKIIDFGQTSEETKLKMGAQLQERYFYVHHTNEILNKIINKSKNLLEYKHNLQKFDVYKEEKILEQNESIIS
ncbi:MAG: GNAT family N-acetyltransferase [Oscillospiraceae bacterium]|nr:GNAT family N-acetyltransferase [Oscillospiraceae bacterium]